MSRSDRYRSNDPILSTRVFDSSGPRSTLRFLRITLIIACCIVLFACVALIAAGVNNVQMANATDEQALAKLEHYRAQDFVDLDAYLQSRDFKATGTFGQYAYRGHGKTIMIHEMGDYVRIGDGEGNVREFGVPISGYTILDDGSTQYDKYICRISWEEEGDRQARDIYLSREALAEIVRLIYR